MLTIAQKATLKAAINANPAWAAYPNDSDGAYNLAQVLNQKASPAFKVWRTEAPTDAIMDAIAFSSYTPNDAVLSSDTDPALSRKIGWLLTIQTKQMNLQLMVQGRQSIDTSKANVRAGLRDAVILVPAGAGGTNVSPGGASGATVMTACLRDATEAEKILTTGHQSTGGVTADVMGYEGSISPQDVQEARNS